METITYGRDTEYQSLRSLLRSSEREGMTAQMLALALKQELTPRQMQLVRMYYIEQRTMRDIAAILKINPSTVSRTLKSSREKLKRCLRYTNRVFLHDDGEE